LHRPALLLRAVSLRRHLSISLPSSNSPLEGPATTILTWRGRQKGDPKRRLEHQLPRYFAQALRLRIPRTPTVSSSTVTVRDTAVLARFSSLRIAPLAHWTRWAPAFAGVTFVCGPRMCLAPVCLRPPACVWPPVRLRPPARHTGERRYPQPLVATTAAGATEMERRASEASNAPQRERQEGKRSEAAHQATREPGSAGRPVAPLGGRSEATGGPIF